jgi:hypothetical protein
MPPPWHYSLNLPSATFIPFFFVFTVFALGDKHVIFLGVLAVHDLILYAPLVMVVFASFK